MDLFTMFQKFPTHDDCIAYLEKARWGDAPICPHCGSDDVARTNTKGRPGRWNCHTCKSSFNVMSGTIFMGTKVPLQKWFVCIALLLNAKKSVSSHQLARDLNMNQKTAWFMAMRIRAAMVEKDALLTGIVEADETFVGGKPRHSDKYKDEPPKRGRGTKKNPVVGAVARGGKVVAQPVKKVNASTLRAFLTKHIKSGDTLLVTDEFPAYNRMNESMYHMTINHSITYVQGLLHTNTIEGFWSLVKRAVFGQHHHYTPDHISAYIVEACYKYNNRNNSNVFDSFIQGAMATQPLSVNTTR